MVDLVVRAKTAIGIFATGAEAAQVTGLAVVRTTATFVDLSWNSAAGADSYIVYANGIAVTGSTTNSVRVSGLTQSTLYVFEVAGVNIDLEIGLKSTSVQTTTLATPEWIGIPFPLFDLGVASTYDLKPFISPTPTTGYTFTNIDTALPSGVTLGGSTGILTFDGIGGLSDASTYDFRYNNGVDPVTDIINVRIQIKDDTIPTVPTNLGSASITPATFTLSWTASTDPGANLDGYKIWRNGQLFATVGVVTSFAVTGQADGSTNSWRLSAFDTANNESPQSAALSVTQTSSVFTWSTNVVPYLPIIPGAAGWGMHTTAGSGRESISAGLAAAPTIYFVTNLNLSGAGSLKAALTATGRRIIIPTVSGVIDYRGQSETLVTGNGRRIHIADGNFIYAGQCAPSPGLFLYGAHIAFVASAAISNVLIWHLASYQDIYVDDIARDVYGDVIQIGGQQIKTNIVIANCLLSYGSDELLDCYSGLNGATVWQNIFAEAISGTTHPTGVQGAYGPLFGNIAVLCRVSVLRNYFAHLTARGPLTRARYVTLANNLTYNHGNRGFQLENEGGITTETNIEGNLFIKGPNSNTAPIWRNPSGGVAYLAGSNYYLNGNRGIEWDDSPEADLLSGSGGTSVGARIESVYPPGYTVTSTSNREEFARLVMRHAGPRPTDRISHIQRVINHAEARITGTGAQGGIISSTSQAGGFPSVANNSVNHTQGADPIPGITTQTSTPTVLGTAGRTIQASTYTTIEEWLHRRHNEKMPSG